MKDASVEGEHTGTFLTDTAVVMQVEKTFFPKRERHRHTHTPHAILISAHTLLVDRPSALMLT